MKSILILLFALLVCNAALAQTADILARWSTPSTGSPAVEYRLEASFDGGPFSLVATTPDTFAIFEAPILTQIVARVAGVDELERQGAFSDETPPFVVDYGPPGAPTILEWSYDE